MNPVSSNLAPALAGGLPLEALLAATASASKPAASSATADTLAPAKTSSTAGAKKAPATKTTSSAKKTTTSSAKKTTASSTKKTTSTSKPGYAATASLPKDLAFLRDAKLSVEEKLVRLAALLNARSEAEIQKKMEALAGGVAGGASAKTGGTPQTGAKPKPKKKGFWSKALDSVQVMFPAVGLSMQLLKTPATRNALKQVGGPVLAAAATALGFPQAAPALLRYGPGVVDFAAGALQAVEKAASAEDKAAAEPAAGSSSASASASAAASGTGAAKNEQLQLLELTRLLDQQKLLMSTISNVLKSMHDTKSHIIGNLR
jgi:hypothetical protein